MCLSVLNKRILDHLGPEFRWKGTAILIKCFAKYFISRDAHSQIPRWYHVKCFFNTCSVSSTNDIGNFDSLRWEDQQSVKETLTAGASYDMVTEYARSNRSSCHGHQCYKKIDHVKLLLYLLVISVPFVYAVTLEPFLYACIQLYNHFLSSMNYVLA